MTSFSEKGVTAVDNPFPVELLAFTAQPIGKQRVELNWLTATELNAKSFEVERLDQEYKPITIGSLPASGTSTQPKSYSFVDNNALPGTSYYRLRQVDQNGSSNYSRLVEVTVSDTWEPQQVVLYPNPVVEGQPIELNLPATKTDQYTIRVLNLAGQTIHSQDLAIQPRPSGRMLINIPTTQWAPGVYYIHVRGHHSWSSLSRVVVR
jgi:hypothetical protein